MSGDSQEISFQIIGAVGEAKGLFIEAMRAVRAGDLERAQECVAQGDEAYQRGHAVHGTILASFASGEDVPMDILLVHAECQMMSAEDFSVLAHEALDDALERQGL